MHCDFLFINMKNVQFLLHPIHTAAVSLMLLACSLKIKFCQQCLAKAATAKQSTLSVVAQLCRPSFVRNEARNACISNTIFRGRESDLSDANVCA
jgi:hypothetical protein